MVAKMADFLLHDSATAQWHALVCEAESELARQLDEESESYLVLTLGRFTERADFVSQVMATEYLESLQQGGEGGRQRLRDVGDGCLLFSGLFPGLARRRRLKISYYVELGRSAYTALSESAAGALSGLYQHLADDFVPMMDVLQAIRQRGSRVCLTDPLQAWELWQETGSQAAFADLSSGGDRLPVNFTDNSKH